MILRKLCGVLAGALALLLGAASVRFFLVLVLPRLKAASVGTAHTTVIVAGIQFSGWQVFIPAGVLIAGAVGLVWWSIALLTPKE